jgi:hypothetical protein
MNDASRAGWSPPVHEFDLTGVDAFVWLDRHLDGHYFHSTPWVNWQSILADRAIRPAADGFRNSALHCRNAFFPKRGCVCVFDWKTRVIEDGADDTYSYRTRCHPLRGGDGGVTALLVLRDSIAASLISWRQCWEQHALDEMVVPHVEAGHRGPIPIEQVERVLAVTLPKEKPWPGCLLEGLSESALESPLKTPHRPIH